MDELNKSLEALLAELRALRGAQMDANSAIIDAVDAVKKSLDL